MLGSLFKRTGSYNNKTGENDPGLSSRSKTSKLSTLNLGYPNHSGLSHSSASSSASSLSSPILNTNDESHTGSLLYGNVSSIPQSKFKLSDKTGSFRLLALQDGGIRSKYALFDSSSSTQNNNLNTKSYDSLNHITSQTIPPSSLNKSMYHSVNELSTYMFGYYGILISDTTSVTKMHYLPSLPSIPSSILISRLFSLAPNFKPKSEVKSNVESDWNPIPSISVDDTPESAMSDTTRFAVGIVIPIPNDDQCIKEIITDNWDEINSHLVGIQMQVTNKLKLLHISQRMQRKQQAAQSSQSVPVHQSKMAGYSSSCSSNNTKKLNFPANILQKDYDVHQSLNSFIRSMVYLVETPRLFISLKNSDYTLMHWASTVASWLELKDGRQTVLSWPSTPSTEVSTSASRSTSPYPSSPSLINVNSAAAPSSVVTHQTQVNGLKFLSSLISILAPLRNEIIQKPNRSCDNKRSVKVVIVTGNPIVSQKLIFILAGIIGYEHFQFLSGDDSDASSEHTDEHNGSLSSSNDDDENTFVETATVNSNGTPDEENSIRDQKKGITIDDSSIFTKPIPILRQNSDFNSNASSSVSPSSVSKGGWEIPTKSTISSSPVYRTLETATTERVPIPQVRRTSSYASLQNLSSSFTSQQTSASSSWRNTHIGSFIDRLRFSSASTNPNGSSLNPGAFNSTLNPSLSNETAAYMTPSPSTEYDEYPWKGSNSPMTTPSNSVHRLSKAMSVVELNNSYNNNSGSPHAAVNYCGGVSLSGNYAGALDGNNNHGGYRGISRVKNYQFMTKDNVNLSRSTTSIKQNNSDDLRIKEKIEKIMKGELEFEISIEVGNIKILNLPLPSSFTSSSFSSKTPLNSELNKNNDKLPLLIGYVDQFRPEFSLMSCPQHRDLELQITESMKRDITKLGPNSKSKTILINLRQREIKSIDLDYPTSHVQQSILTPSSDIGGSSPSDSQQISNFYFSSLMSQPNMPVTSDNGATSSASASASASTLASSSASAAPATLIASMKPTTTVLFSPSMRSKRDNSQSAFSSSLSSTTSMLSTYYGKQNQTVRSEEIKKDLVDAYDSKLNGIASLLNQLNHIDHLKTMKDSNINGFNSTIKEEPSIDSMYGEESSKGDAKPGVQITEDEAESQVAEGCAGIRMLIEEMLQLGC